jgi:hypothetical protein
MTRTEYVSKLNRLRKLIDVGNTGIPSKLAKRFNISERTLRRLVADLKKEDKSIYYDRDANSYCRAKK